MSPRSTVNGGSAASNGTATIRTQNKASRMRIGGLRRSFLRQGNAEDFFIVSGIHALVRERRVHPHHRAIDEVIRRLQHLDAAEFFVTVGTQVCENQFAVLIEDEKAV